MEKLCGLFGKSRQAFYDHSWRHNDEQLHEAWIIDRVKAVRLTMPGIGCQKLFIVLKDELREHGIQIGRDNFYKLLKQHELLIKRRKRYVQTTQSYHRFKKWDDLTVNLCVESVEELWVSDITYLRTETGFVYLSLITDVYSRKIVGYHLSQKLKVDGCISALNKAIASLSQSGHHRALIHHSDRGIQYCCDQYISILQKNEIRISMTQSGSPYDNAIAERVNGILKQQFCLDKVFENYGVSVDAVSKAIDGYNRLRPHA
ncbi:MAG TPA: IS3 family transposase, partial [Candidatus Paceibacterota bacterium]|nr:IS3 family transposase [Candidatus Paceibacterota bacterium]